jgi:hypothetical protein
MSKVKVWWSWYDQNQLKFNFWLIYLAAVCDDFGIPNLKSLVRWGWRKWRAKGSKNSNTQQSTANIQ